MNSLQELNNFNNLLSWTYTDLRPAKVIFNTNVFYNKEISITSTTITVEPTYDIREIINYATADCRYRITILSTDPAFVSSSSITWASLPSGVTLSSGSGVYTLSGINTTDTWDLIKNPTWTLPAGYASYDIFYIRVGVVYYDEELAQEITREIDIYDKDFYYDMQCFSSTSLTCLPNSTFRPTTTLNAVANLTAEGEDVFQSATIGPAQFSVTCTPTRIPVQFVGRNGSGFTAHAYDVNSQDYLLNIVTSSGPLQNGYSKVRWSKKDLVAVGDFIYDPASSEGVFTIAFFKPNASNTFDWVYTLESFNYQIPPASSRDQYKISDFKFRDDGGAIILGGNPVSGAEIWTISDSFVFTRQTNTGSNTTTTFRVALHPNGEWACNTGRWERLDVTPANRVTLLKWNGTQWVLNNYNSGVNLVTSNQATSDVAWDPTGNYFSLCVDNDNALYYFNPSASPQPTFTLLTVMPLNSAGKTIKWSTTGTYIAVHTTDRVYIRKLSGSGAGATFTSLYTFNISGIQDIDWKFDETVLTVATTTGFKNIYRAGDVFTLDTTTNITDSVTTVAWRKQ